MKLPDIDIDLADRNKLRDLLPKVTHASRIVDGDILPHNHGVYFQNIPVDPFTKLSSIDHKEAEKRGYFKVDLLNVGTYKKFSSNAEIDKLLKKEPEWELLEYREIVSLLSHIHNHFDVVNYVKPKSVLDLAYCVALVRPGKRHLKNKTKDFMIERIWLPEEDGFIFKKSHAIAYATLIKLELLLIEKEAI